MHTVRRLPDGGKGMTLGSAELASVELPAAPWQRWIALAGGELTEDITSRENGAEIPADKVGSAIKAIADAMDKTARLDLDRAYTK